MSDASLSQRKPHAAAMDLFRDNLRALLLAITLLTRIRVPQIADPPEVRRKLAFVYFPAVGAFVGLTGSWLHAAVAGALPAMLAATITVASLALITGAIHEDGLADAADGLGGGWSREESLAIMRDSRIGSYGALALLIATLTKIFVIAESPMHAVQPILVTGHVLSRWSSLPLTYALRYARQGEGAATFIAGRVTKWTMALASLLTIVLISGAGAGAVASTGVALLALMLTALSGFYYKRRLGGYTGDCLGATNQLVECVVMTAYLVQFRNST